MGGGRSLRSTDGHAALKGRAVPIGPYGQGLWFVSIVRP